jgi:transcriptional regulator with XRE-family HTH domain
VQTCKARHSRGGDKQAVSARERDTTGLSLFVAELVAARMAAGLSQDALAAQINYSPSLIGMIESGRRAPTLDVAGRLDKAFKVPGTFARLQQHDRTTPLPSWFRPYAEIEATAVQLRSWQPMVVDGLLQTEGYARALLGAQPNTTDDELEERVTARMARQVILDRPDPPVLWVLLDEAVLIRRVGGAKVMNDQLLHLERMSHRPNITIGIVPLSAGAHSGLLGAFAIAESNTARVGFMETPQEGLIVEHSPAVSRMLHVFDNLHAETLPRAASRALILKRADDHDPEPH